MYRWAKAVGVASGEALWGGLEGERPELAVLHEWVPGYPDAAPVLDALARRHPLALVTNGLPSLRREKLAASGLEGYFGGVVVAGELGVGKPDPSAFTAALTGLGAAGDGAVMIGDSLTRDIDGVPRIRTLAELPVLLSASTCTLSIWGMVNVRLVAG